MSLIKTQLLVIGAGPGGYAAAFYAADRGMEVTLVDREPDPGGVCLYRGCIPSKAFLHAAKVLSEARDAKELGIVFNEPRIDVDRLRTWKNDVVSKMTGSLGLLARHRKVTFMQGKATFINSNTVSIQQEGESRQEVQFEHTILATGSRPVSLPGVPDSPLILNSTTALDLTDVPPSLLVIGGGYIGLELGTVYAELGSKVSVVEMTPGLLPGADRDLVSILEKRLKTIFRAIMLTTKVVKIEAGPQNVKVTFETADGKTSEETYDKILVAVGRKPNSHDLGLDHTKVKITPQSFVAVDLQRRTTDPSIFAIGDVAGEPMLAHKAAHEARVAVDAISGKKTTFEPKAIPAVVFTDPEIAWCGLTEAQAKQENRTIAVAKFPWGASGRAMTLNRTDGLTKLILDPDTKRVLGMAIVGPGAGELIAEGVLAIEMGSIAEDLTLTIHPHPTTSETIMEAAENFFGHATHIYRPKKT